MAIIDTLTTIKDYFINWHDKYYDTIHKKTIDDLNTEKQNRIDGDVDLLNKITYPNLLASQVRDTTRNSPNGQSVQTTLDQYGNKLNTYADAGTVDLKKDYDIDPNGENGGPRGFYSFMSKKQNGLMSWQDKAVLRYTGEWYEKTNAEWPSLHPSFRIWFNPALRLVYFYFFLENCTWLKSDTSNFTTWGCSSDNAWYHVRPIRNIWGATNHVGVNFCVASDGVFYLKSSQKISKGTYTGSAMWFYRDSNMYNKLR